MFDFKNHICMVFDLLGQSIYDWLKDNNFCAFPHNHIQFFARQLLTSVSCTFSVCNIYADQILLSETLLAAVTNTVTFYAAFFYLVLHRLRLIHTDLKPENILLANGAYKHASYSVSLDFFVQRSGGIWTEEWIKKYLFLVDLFFLWRQ